jgi:aspartyl-tRNA synthetase
MNKMLLKTHDCGTLTKANAGEMVTLNGWAQRRRDFGGLLFIDLRDRSGIVQIVCNPEINAEALEIGDKVRNEFVLAVHGKVVERDAETINSNLATGEIEIQVEVIEVLNAAKNPPFFIEDEIEIDENIRLKYRYLDIRRPEMQKTLLLRSKSAKIFRDFLDDHGFLEVETPILTKSTPEGARDYLVPSRVHPGEFFALPQSPQIFKQLLMVGGVERYYQIARCFRDEDLRADRQPEFTQVDIETSFMTDQQLQDMMEELLVRLFKETVNVEIPRPFQRISYADAINRYGSDKPDLRFGLELVDLSDVLATSEVKVFASVIEKGGQVKAINAKGCADWSRKDIDDLGVYAARYGAKGLAWIVVKEGEWRGPIVKFFKPEEIAALTERLQVEEGDLLLFSADTKKVVADVLGNLRLKLGKQLNLIDESQFKFAWVVDFPLLSYDDQSKRYVAEHHPFTRPNPEDVHYFDTDPGKIRAVAYDITLNGYEIGGGSMRIYQRSVQEKMFQALGFSEEEAQEKFGFLLEAFEYGTPPHGGIAFGFDRIVMLLAGRNNLRDTIAFPKTASASCPLTDAPGEVDAKQLEELSIRVARKQPVAKP